MLKKRIDSRYLAKESGKFAEVTGGKIGLPMTARMMRGITPSGR
ncbi:hypothetical protein DAQ1742_02411 [Dickeya aquatica]|uniref:Uncharacterized protein n=1 Tax=Dickeya aquatica TaxID=1401087 RepID=A0A375ACI0_9GAMM|nr:hypothetical protein DAQ1742_02411 [Dickeya aquatica]